MASVIYQTSPETAPAGPSAIPGGGFQRIQSSPADFGALPAAATQRLGGATEQAGGEIFSAYQRQTEMHNAIVADDYTTKFNDAADSLLYTGDNALFKKRGEDYMRSHDVTLQHLENLKEQYQGELNPMQRLQFSRETRYFLQREKRIMGAKFDEAQREYGLTSNKAGTDLDLRNIGKDPNDEDSFNHYRESLRDRFVKNLQLQGLADNPDARSDALVKADAAAWEQRIEALAPTDPNRANDMLEQNKSLLLGPAYDRLHARVTAHADAAQIGSAVNSAMSGSGAVVGQPKVSPDQVRAEAERQGVDPVLANATASIESAHGANIGTGEHAATRGNVFQMGPGERASVGGSTAMGSSDEQVRQGVAFLGQKKIELTAALGREPTNAEIYLAHQQGTGGAVGLIAKPNVRAGDIVGDAAIRDNGGDPNAPANQFVQQWSQKYNATEAQFGGPTGRQGFAQAAGATLDQQLGNVDKLVADGKLRPELAERAKAQVESRWRAHVIDTERIQAAQDKEAKERREQAADEYTKQAIKDPTQVDMDKLTNDPRLDSVTRAHLANAVLSALKQDSGHDTKTYGPGFYEMYQRAHAPDGDPNKLTDVAQLYQHVGPNGDLTMAGVDKLAQEIQGRKTPEGEAEGEMKKQFFAMAKGQITFENEELHIPDPEGKTRYLKFMAHALPAYEAGRKAGLSATQLLDPDSKDYIGKIIDQFKRPPAELANDVLKDKDQPGPLSRAWRYLNAPPPPPPAAIAHLRSQPELKNAFDEKYGAGAADAALKQPVSVPETQAPMR